MALRQAASIGLVAALFCAVGSGARAQDAFTPLFSDGYKGWTADSGRPTVSSSVVTLGREVGWLTYDKSLTNFVVRFEARMASPETRAGIIVRSWRDHRTKVPIRAYVVVAGAGEANRGMTGSIIEYGAAGPGPPSRGSVLDEPATAVAADAWRQFEIECIDDRIKVTIDGKVVSEITNVQSPRGLLGLSAAAGSVEFRNVALRELSAPARMRPDGVYIPGDGIVLPSVTREVKPRYTRDAMNARIQGTVWVEAVVQRDGTLTDLTIIRSLDPKHGLDREALRAASQWRFTPATKDGQPVPILITIELTFTLRK